MKARFVCSLILFLLCSLGPLSLADDILRGGFAKVDITPSQPVTLSGYANRKELSTGVHDSLSARISVFQSNENKLVLVSTDVIGFYSGTDKIIRRAIWQEFDLQPEELFLSAIHTHAGPSITLNTERGHPNNVVYTQQLQKQLIKGIRGAMSEMFPVQIGMGKGSSPVGVNRRQVYYDEQGNPRMWIGRNPDGAHDNEVTVLKVTQNQDKTVAVLWDYATHSTALGWENFSISGDVHGLAEQFIETYLGAPIIAPAFVGASGDIDPWYRVLPGFETKNGWIPEPVLMGVMLGEEVVHVLHSIDTTVVMGEISAIYETLELPGKPSGEFTTPEDHPPVPLNVTVAKIGNIAWVGLGAEVTCEIGMAIKQASPFDCTMIVTHCNGTADYIPSQHLYVQQGYEVKSSPFASTAADLLIKRVVTLLHQIEDTEL